MFLFILGILLVAAAAGVYLYWRRDPARGTVQGRPSWLRWTAIGVGLLGLVAVVWSFTFTVGTKEEGILTSFGKTSGHAGAGLHVKTPWEKVHEMDAAIQTDVHASQQSGKTKGASWSGPCINTRIANQQVACVDITLRWRIKENSSDELYRDYRSFDHVRESLVSRELLTAVNEKLADYNPLNAITAGQPANGANPSNGDLSSSIRKLMAAEIGDRIEVRSVGISFIGFDDATQGRLNQLQQQIALTRIAEAKLVTNQKQAAANRALSASVNASPNVLVAQCLDTLEQMVKQHESVPAGFTCWPGGGVAGVIANSNGK